MNDEKFPPFEIRNTEFAFTRFTPDDMYILTFVIKTQGFSKVIFSLNKKQMLTLIKFLTTSISENYLPSDTIGYFGYDILIGPMKFTNKMRSGMKQVSKPTRTKPLLNHKEEMNNNLVGSFFNLSKKTTQLFISREKFLRFRKFCIGLKSKLDADHF
jgi:hypothetical protein